MNNRNTEYQKFLVRTSIKILMLSLVAFLVFGVNVCTVTIPTTGFTVIFLFFVSSWCVDRLFSKKLSLDPAEALLGSHQVIVKTIPVNVSTSTKLVVEALNDLENCYPIEIQNDKDFAIVKALTEDRFFRPGSIIVISVSAENETSSKVTLSSKPNHRFNFFDNGHNVQNIRELEKMLSRAIE